MTKKSLLEATALRSVAIGLAFAFTTPALAQETQEDQAQNPPETLSTEQEVESGQNATTDQAIVVTGSRIRRPNLESVVPVTSVGGEEFFETGQTSVGDTLNELPALRSTFSQANSTRFLGTAGLNLLDLRGLGTQRTLVLVNGRRHIASNVLGNAVEVDVNTIPTDLIERVDIVTGGNSAIYGSDAIAGVVNFVLKQDYEGIQVRGQGGISKYGDAGSYYVSALGGKNFADGRGNIAVNLEFAKQDAFYASQRGKCFSTVCAFLIVDDDADNPTGADGVPDRRFFEDVRFPYFANGGSLWVGFPYLDGVPGRRAPGYFANSYLFQPDGTLIQQTGERIGTPYFGYFLGGNGSNFREGKQFGFQPNLKRYSANLLAHFDVSDAVKPFIEAKFVRTDSLGNASGPFFGPSIGELYPSNCFDDDNDPTTPDSCPAGPNQGGTGIYPTRFSNALGAFVPLSRENVFTSNPFLNPQARTLLENNYYTYFSVYRNYLDLGNREEKARRDTYQIVAGVRGDFNDDWSYEVSANYGKLKENTRILGNVNMQRFLLALDAVDDGTGNIVCHSQIDPNFALGLAGNTFGQQQLANDVAACVPVNVFGPGNITDAARNYILQDTVAKGWIKQFVVNAFMSGDTSEFLNLPGGPIGFALGAEHRTYDISYKQDAFTSNGLTFYNAIPDFTPPKFRVNEVFGEVRLPILKDQFVHELTLSGAARYAKYKTFGGVWAYNYGAELAPTRDIRFRGNFSRAVRAPSLADAFTPLGVNFTPAPTDPCDVSSINNGTSSRPANCAADGVPAGYVFKYNQSLQYQSGGNVNLKPETADSVTLGGVFTPQWIPGLSLSVDYYKITVNDVITAPTVQDVLNACYDLPSIDNPFCALFDRNPGPGLGPKGEIPGRILEGNLQLVPVNYAKLRVRGIDVEAAYRTNLFNIGRLDTRFIYTYVMQNDQFLDPTNPGFADQILYELGDPEDAFNWNNSLKVGKFTFGYQMRYIGKMLINGAEYETFFSKQGRPPEDSDYSERKFYPSVFYHDIRASVDVTPRFNFYLGVDDVTNKKPPFGQSGAGGGSGIYRNIGRFFYGGVVAKF